MTPPKERAGELTDTGARLRAIGEAVVRDATDRLLEERQGTTGASSESIDHGDSADRMRSVAAVASDVAEVKITKHALDCLRPGGGLCTVGQKMDKLTRSVLLATGAVLLVGASLPFFWQQINSRLQTLDNLRVDVAALIAQHQHQSAAKP